MTEVKEYQIQLKPDLTGWKKVRVQVDVFSTGGKQRMVKLKEEFEVLPRRRRGRQLCHQ